jgi:hypothetical protein
MIINSEFYWKHIDIDDYDNIIDEIRYYMTDELKNTVYPYGFSVYNNKSKFHENCGLFMNWADNHSLKIRRIAVIKLPPNRTQDIHRDCIEDLTNTYGLNLNLYNCENSYTRMFELIDENYVPETSYTSDGRPFIPYQKSHCREVTRYNLSKPVLLDLNKLHSVVNNTNDTRISISIRFTTKPDLLIN